MRTTAVIIAIGLLLTATAAASASGKRASQTIPTSQVAVSSAPGQAVPQSFLGLSVNVEEMDPVPSDAMFMLRFDESIVWEPDGLQFSAEAIDGIAKAHSAITAAKSRTLFFDNFFMTCS